MIPWLWTGVSITCFGYAVFLMRGSWRHWQHERALTERVRADEQAKTAAMRNQ